MRDAATEALASKSGPILLDRYLGGLEVELDALADGTNLPIPALMEQIERAGVHSGDSLALLAALGAPGRRRKCCKCNGRSSAPSEARGLDTLQTSAIQADLPDD